MGALTRMRLEPRALARGAAMRDDASRGGDRGHGGAKSGGHIADHLRQAAKYGAQARLLQRDRQNDWRVVDDRRRGKGRRLAW